MGVPDDNLELDVSDDASLQDSEDVQKQDASYSVVFGNATPAPAQSTSKISASNVNGYTSFPVKFTVNLVIDGKKAVGKRVIISINDKNYTRITDDNGQAFLNIYLAKGTHKVQYFFAGDKNTKASSGASSIIIRDAVKTNLKVGDAYINYRQGLKSLFYVKLTDARGNPIKSKNIIFKSLGKTYNAKTDSKGNAKIYLNLAKGNHMVYFYFVKESPYLASKGSTKIFFREPLTKGNGYWMWPSHMSSTNLKTLANRGTKHIFLESYALTAYGSTYVSS